MSDDERAMGLRNAAGLLAQARALKDAGVEMEPTGPLDRATTSGLLLVAQILLQRLVEATGVSAVEHLRQLSPEAAELEALAERDTDDEP